MRSLVAFVILSTSLYTRADLPYKLPPKAKYTASNASILKAKTELSEKLVTNALALTNLFSSPLMCGPGLWNVLKDSTHFSNPLIAKGTVKIPVGKGKTVKLPMALLQSEDEIAAFRKALTDLLKAQGRLTIREPNKDEFMKYWAVIPFDTINGPLLVADGKDAAIFFQFEKERVLWVDEVKRTQFKK